MFVNLRCLLLVAFASFVASLYSKDYYVDSRNGDDGAGGISESQAWRTLERVNAMTFKAGDRILLKAGGVWRGCFMPKGSGKEGEPIVLSSYGEGPAPRIEGDGQANRNEASEKAISAAIRLYNQEHWWIQNLEVTNYNPSEEGGLSLAKWERRNVRKYEKVDTPKPMEESRILKTAILVQSKGANDKGALAGFRFRNLFIHGVNGDMGTKHNGGIFFRVYDDGSGVPMRFDDVRIENCAIQDVDRTGVSNVSDFDKRDLNDPGNWTPNRGWVISGNTFRRTGANALIVRVATGPLIEKNLFDACAIKGSGNAAFNFNTDGAVWQHNEFRYTKANEGDEDAGGVDSDYRSKNTLIQLNYSHHNDFGMLVTGGPGRFNDGTVVRDNVFEEDGQQERKGGEGRFMVRLSGSATNTVFYRNTFILGEGQVDTKLIFHKRWKTWTEGTTYRENTVINRSRGAFIDLGESRRNWFVDNRYFGAPIEEPVGEMDVFLLIGQSNMAGRAELGEHADEVVSGFKLLDSEGRWVPLSNPLNRFSTVRKRMGMQKLGPGFGFAKRLQELRPGRTLGLVVNARGGTKIEAWAKGSVYFEEAVERARVAMRHGKLRGILWHQGEGNSKDERYYEKLVELVDSLREALGDPELPFVAGQVEGERFVNSEIARLADYRRCAVAFSDGLATFDGTHFDTPSALELGERFAEALAPLLD